MSASGKWRPLDYAGCRTFFEERYPVSLAICAATNSQRKLDSATSLSCAQNDGIELFLRVSVS
ncbi:MAG: hypothetical protein GQF41_3972 [Candidatus Rifleibacterium amylolyticum]|nr:MAG: hypothetical protein GQF41_3972 [Candidatus Rifleibacterium amylolyticum]